MLGKLCNLVFLSVQSITNTRRWIISYCLLVLYGGYYESPENCQIYEHDWLNSYLKVSFILHVNKLGRTIVVLYGTLALPRMLPIPTKRKGVSYKLCKLDKDFIVAATFPPTLIWLSTQSISSQGSIHAHMWPNTMCRPFKCLSQKQQRMSTSVLLVTSVVPSPKSSAFYH